RPVDTRIRPARSSAVKDVAVAITTDSTTSVRLKFPLITTRYPSVYAVAAPDDRKRRLPAPEAGTIAMLARDVAISNHRESGFVGCVFELSLVQEGNPYSAPQPPSITRLCPVIKADASEARNTTPPAMSRGRANRPSGVRSSRRVPCTSCPRSPCVRSVSTQPGASVLTLTPRFAQSSASALLSNSTPPFEAQYGTDRGRPPCPATELTLITDPPSWIAPPIYLQHRNKPVRL